MAFTAIDARGNTVVYRDGKRYLWLLSPILATIPMISLGLYFLTGKSNLTTLIPFAFIFGVIPVMDAWLGEDSHNPPAEIVAAMEADPYYARLAWATVPIYWLSFLSVAYWVGAQTLPWWSWIVLAIGVGTGDGGGGLTVGHELGHKSGRVNRGAAFLANNLCGYGHFRIEHNRGHHTWVSTPEDPASARYGESIYRFAARELPGAFRRGWLQEAERLQRRGKSAWSFENEILQGYAFTFAVAAGLIAAFGLKLALFLAAHHFIGWYSLTQANYVEHYGLLRQTLPNGRYEPVQPRHSWNTNHIFSNLATFHLQRHSDHHANPMRPYQSLRDFKDLPRLPSGYPGMFALAAIPPIWFRVMNPRVMAWADGDLAKVNARAGARPPSREGGTSRFADLDLAPATEPPKETAQPAERDAAAGSRSAL